MSDAFGDFSSGKRPLETFWELICPVECPGTLFGAYFAGGLLCHRGNIQSGISRVNVQIRMQDYKSLHVAHVTETILVNTHTDRQTN